MAERVWEQFLTEQDKATLVSKAEADRFRREAGLVVDRPVSVGFRRQAGAGHRSDQNLAGKLRARGLGRASTYSKTAR